MKKQIITCVGILALLSACSAQQDGRCFSVNCSSARQECPKKGVLMKENTAYFSLNSDQLTKSDKQSLSKTAEQLVKNTQEKAVVKGYTDSTGTKDYNLALSKRRANVVAQYLEDKGVAKNRITTKGYGANDFVASNATAEGRAKNRRTVVTFEK